VAPSSSSSAPDRIVFDCNIFLQFLLNPNGPAGRCISLALARQVELLLSEPVLTELRELPEKPVAIKYGIDDQIISRFILSLLQQAVYLENVTEQFQHPIDPDDSCYVNLALAGNAMLIVSRDKHLLGLNDPAKPWSEEFRRRFPHLRILTAEAFLREQDRSRAISDIT
jgi:putative PIN family toxin of toxin-antitoxin system